jgi:hypothetical protein
MCYVLETSSSKKNNFLSLLHDIYCVSLGRWFWTVIYLTSIKTTCSTRSLLLSFTYNSLPKISLVIPLIFIFEPQNTADVLRSRNSVIWIMQRLFTVHHRNVTWISRIQSTYHFFSLDDCSFIFFTLFTFHNFCSGCQLWLPAPGIKKTYPCKI